MISNDPFRGGTLLPDVALSAPFFAGDGSVTGASTERLLLLGLPAGGPCLVMPNRKEDT